LFAVARRETGTLGINSPPALEAPEALVSHPEPWDAPATSARIAGLEVEETLEHRGCAGAVGLALAAVEQKDARRPRADLVWCALRAAATVAPGLRDPSPAATIGSRLDRTLWTASRSRRGVRPRLNLRPA
jgi:hypothetical protein